MSSNVGDMNRFCPVSVLFLLVNPIKLYFFSPFFFVFLYLPYILILLCTHKIFYRLDLKVNGHLGYLRKLVMNMLEYVTFGNGCQL